MHEEVDINKKADSDIKTEKTDKSILQIIKEQAIKKNKEKTDKILNDLNQGKY